MATPKKMSVKLNRLSSDESVDDTRYVNGEYPTEKDWKTARKRTKTEDDEIARNALIRAFSLAADNRYDEAREIVLTIVDPIHAKWGWTLMEPVHFPSFKNSKN